MAKIIIRKELEDFLRQEGILEMFIEDAKRHCDSINRITEWVVIGINVAFVWHDTKEGWNYWNDVNNKWGDYRLKTKFSDHR